MEKAYQCGICKRSVIQDAGEPVPFCCGSAMKEVDLPSCRSAGPEAARFSNSDTPCEDFTGNQIE
ncbi:hypothetical protein K7I13_03260 [Brucepastera parasyntrophica]|uniref:hypothetical protein n=1 Tax=Brucepastera parasyntrophica TaxID=2880008 RepID=UPI00210E8F4B|nr:hypothetical protein [Brucepastera parasyntrophica]ULQ60341.1 hypothetical protein K7I13_03260 [Brucepastera parasyntrophica]